MNVLYVLDEGSHFNCQESLILELCRRGHQVRVLYDMCLPDASDELLKLRAAEHHGLQLGLLDQCRGLGRSILIRSREILTYSSYLHRAYQSGFYRQRWHSRVMKPARLAARWAPGRALLGGRGFRSALQWFERAVPAPAAIRRQLRQDRPDVVVASPCNLYHSREVEYIKAANALGIPTVVPVLTWDNLTTKGLIHALPDVLLAWNSHHVREAISIHGFSAAGVVMIGSPLFDKWFETERLLVDRSTFCRKAGLDADRPFVLYLGSSRSIAADESWLVRRLVDCLRSSDDARLRGLGLVVRPHPNNAEIYEPLAKEGIVVWPPRGHSPDTQEAIQDYYNTLRHCALAAGINTTGMLDSVIVDRPTVTILTDRYRQTQSEAVHFSQLREANVLEVTGSAEEGVRRIGDLLAGADAKKDLRRKFVLDFVRPWGLHRSAGELGATAVEMAASGCNGAAINAHFAGLSAER